MNIDAAITASGKELGYDFLNEKQREAATSILSGRDTFVALPMGYGKSIIYALLPFAFDKYRGKSYLGTFGRILVLYIIGTTGSRVVCISPLTSLMMDQCAKYSPKGLPVEFVGEAQADPLIEAKKENLKLLYISPESAICNCKYRMFMSPKYRENLVALAIDEAHSVKTCGDDFRTTFALLVNYVVSFPVGHVSLH